MRYSCFNDKTGMYRVFEDAAAVPVNGDLPVPALGAELNDIGVPSVDAARPLPSSAVFREESYRPVGLIVDCGRSGGFGAIDGSTSPFLLLVVGFAAGFLVSRVML